MEATLCLLLVGKASGETAEKHNFLTVAELAVEINLFTLCAICGTLLTLKEFY
jgi:hypothetical protein